MKKFRSTFQFKIFAIKEIIKSNKFIILNFKQQSDTKGNVEAMLTKGFTNGELKTYMDVSEIFQRSSMREDLIIKNNLEKAKRLIKA